MIIYKTTNLINGKIYIGQDTKNSINYIGSGKILKHAIKKYGKVNFRKEIIEYCKTIEELNDKEIYWINFFNSKDPDIGYNISDGGFGCKGFKQTKESIEAIKKNSNSEGFKKIMRSEDTKRKISNGQKNSERKKKLHESEEYRMKMSESLKGRIVSTETRKKLSDSLKGKTKSEEHKKKLSISISKINKGESNPFYNKKHSQETKNKIKDSLLRRRNP